MYNPKIDSSKKDEGEQNVAIRMLSRVMNEYINFIDVVVYDALVFNSVWINICRSLGVEAIIRVKNSNNNSLREIKTRANKSMPVVVCGNEKNIEKIDVYEQTFIMPGVEQVLRFVKFTIKYPNKKRSQIMIVTTSLELSIETILKMIKARWHIENCIFNNLKNNAELDHCYVHGGNAVEAVVCIIFISSNLFQLFKERRIKNQVPIQKELQDYCSKAYIY